MLAYYELLEQFGDLFTAPYSDLPSLRIYDTSQQSVESAYNTAVVDGADMVIGPMRQSAVDALLAQSALPVCMLGEVYGGLRRFGAVCAGLGSCVAVLCCFLQYW